MTEKEREYHRNYYKENKEHLDNYHKNYYKEHKKYWKDRMEKMKGNYIYRYTSLTNRSIYYVGSTDNLISRLFYHENGFSGIVDYIDGRDYKIDFIDLGEEVSREERLFIEGYLINKYKPIINKIDTGHNYLFEDYRKNELINIAEKIEWTSM